MTKIEATFCKRDDISPAIVYTPGEATMAAEAGMDERTALLVDNQACAGPWARSTPRRLRASAALLCWTVCDSKNWRESSGAASSSSCATRQTPRRPLAERRPM